MQHFETLCCTKTCYETLNQALKQLGGNQHELLRVLDKPYLPLHNNLSERDTRNYVKKRKIRGVHEVIQDERLEIRLSV